MFILADASEKRRFPNEVKGPNIYEYLRQKEINKNSRRRHFGDCFANFPSETTFSGIRGNDDVFSNWLDRIGASGNAQVPSVVKLA